MKLEPCLKDAMTPAERFAAMDKGESIDRVPVYMFLEDIKARLLGKDIATYYHDTEALVAGEIRAFNRFGLDEMGIGPNVRGIAEAIGVQTRYPKQGHVEIVKHRIADLREVETLSPISMAMGNLPRFFEVAKRLREKADGICPVTVYVAGPVTLAGHVYGVENMLLALVKDPKGAHRLLRYVTDCIHTVTDGFAGLDVEYYFADPVASTSLLSPRMYRTFAYPYTEEICRHILEKTGKKATYHVCGNTQKVWEDIRRLPLSCFSIDNAMDIDAACAFFSETMRIAGNVPPVDVLYKGQKETIAESVKHCLAAGKTCQKGFILAPGCNMPLATSEENMDFYMDAARTWG